MKNIHITLLILLTFVLGCKDLAPNAEEFPVIITNQPIEVDESGATFQGKILTNGTLPTTSFGFVWGVKDQIVESSNKIVLNEKPASDVFSIRIDHALAKNVKYKIRAFATTENLTVYGNSIDFLSAGSSQNGWEILDSMAINDNGFIAFNFSSSDYGYLLYHSKMVRFDPSTLQLSNSSNFPASGGDFTNFTAIKSGNDQYVLSALANWLYRLSNEKWYQQAAIPFDYWLFNGRYQGLAVNNQIYCLSSYKSYLYDPATDTWQQKATLPAGNFVSVAGTTLNGKAYVITSDNNLWEYNPDLNNWRIITKFPGILGDKFVSFSYHNQLYFGISTVRQISNLMVDNHLWAYDVAGDKWTKKEDFPSNHAYGGLYYFFLKDNLYIGHENMGVWNTYTLWKYDPSKNTGVSIN